MGLERRGRADRGDSEANPPGEELREEPGPKAKSFEIDKRLIYGAWEKVRANKGGPGVDAVSIGLFEEQVKDNLYKLWNRMSSGSYFPGPVRGVQIPKDHGEGVRLLGVPNTADRVAQTAAAMLLEGELERVFHRDSYGYRPERSAHDALAVCRQRCWKQDWVLDLDVRAFFDSVPHSLLLKAVAHHTSERWVLLCISRWLVAPMQMPDGTVVAREKGTPQGSPISFALTWILLGAKGHAGFVASFNSFAGHPGYYQGIIAAAKAAGYGHTAFSWAATFGVAPVAWTVLAWAMWSVLTAGELKDARRLRSATTTIVGALWINVILITVTAIVVFQVIGSTFLGSLAYLWFADPAKLAALPAAPYFGLLVAAVTTNPLLTVLLSLGFIATAVQILIAMAWGGSRVILALSLDRVLPESLSSVSPRLHAPVRAIAFFFALSVAWTFLYNLTTVSHYTLAVTLASILVYLGTMVAAIVFPYRAKAIYQASPASAYKIFGIPLITVMGAIAFVFNAVMAGYFLVNDKLGVNDPGAEGLIGGSWWPLSSTNTCAGPGSSTRATSPTWPSRSSRPNEARCWPAQRNPPSWLPGAGWYA